MTFGQWLVIACLCIPTAATAWSAEPTAVFDLGFDDTSLQGQEQGPRADEQKRLLSLDHQLRDLLVQSGCCAIVSTTAVAQAAATADWRNCGGCDVDLARKIGACIAVTGWVQKVSNLILNINLVARDVASGRVISAGSVDIRGNTDESWTRGLSYLLRNRMHPAQW